MYFLIRIYEMIDKKKSVLKSGRALHWHCTDWLWLLYMTGSQGMIDASDRDWPLQELHCVTTSLACPGSFIITTG